MYAILDRQLDGESADDGIMEGLEWIMVWLALLDISSSAFKTGCGTCGTFSI